MKKPSHGADSPAGPLLKVGETSRGRQSTLPRSRIRSHSLQQQHPMTVQPHAPHAAVIGPMRPPR